MNPTITGVGERLILLAEARPHPRSNAIKFEGMGGVRALAATFLESVQPRIEAVDVKVAVSEALRGIAPPLTPPSSGVVGIGNVRGMQVEELTDRSRHAQTTFSVAVSTQGAAPCRC